MHSLLCDRPSHSMLQWHCLTRDREISPGNAKAAHLLRNEDQIISKLLGQASCLPGDSRDGYPNLFNSHSLAKWHRWLQGNGFWF